MAKTVIPKAQTVISEPTTKQSKHLVKTYSNNGMKCYKIDSQFVLVNAAGSVIAQKNTLQDIDDEHLLY